MPTVPYAAVLFDLDGVIVDTTELHYRVWDEFGRANGFSPTRADLLATNGRPASETIRQWLGCNMPAAKVAQLTAERESSFNSLLETAPVFIVAGAAAFVTALEKAAIPFAVATSAVRENAILALKRVGMENRFDVIVTANDVVRGKPDPEPYLRAAAALGIAPDQCIVIEDSVSGIRSAKAAGARCLALATTFPREFLFAEKPDWLATNFEDIPAELRPR